MISFEEIYWRDPTRSSNCGEDDRGTMLWNAETATALFQKKYWHDFLPGIRVQRTFVGITFFSCHVFHAIFRKIKGTRFLLHKLRKALPLLLATVALMHIKRIISAP